MNDQCFLLLFYHHHFSSLTTFESQKFAQSLLFKIKTKCEKKKRRNTFAYPQLSQARHSKQKRHLVANVLLFFDFFAVVPLTGVNAADKLPSKPFPEISWIFGLDRNRQFSRLVYICQMTKGLLINFSKNMKNYGDTTFQCILNHQVELDYEFIFTFFLLSLSTLC